MTSFCLSLLMMMKRMNDDNDKDNDDNDKHNDDKDNDENMLTTRWWRASGATRSPRELLVDGSTVRSLNFCLVLACPQSWEPQVITLMICYMQTIYFCNCFVCFLHRVVGQLLSISSKGRLFRYLNLLMFQS